MYLTRLEVEGLRAAGPIVVDGGRPLAALPAGLEGGAVADAIELLAAGLAPGRLRTAAARLGWSTAATEVSGEGFEAELFGLHAPAVSALVAEGQRAVTVAATVALDPPLFGRLREHAHRDPRMVTALGQDPSISVKIGWLFTRDRSGVSPSVLTLRVGDVGFETSGKDRPGWFGELLPEIGRRFGRTDPLEPVGALAERLLAASLSSEPALREGFARLLRLVQEPPWSLPAPGLVRAGDRLELAFGRDLARLRQVGRPAWDALRLVEAAVIGRPDVLVVDEVLSDATRDRLSALCEDADAPVEQVWLR